jgi:hypothetical protein
LLDIIVTFNFYFSRENLLRKLKEDNRRKAEDRIRKKAEEQRLKDEAREIRESKLTARRDEKAQQKLNY